MGKSASLEGPGYKKGHASVSKIISMTKLTPRALAYVVVQVHCLFHLLSSSITIFFWHIMIGTFRNFRCWRMAYCRLHIQLQAVFLESRRYLGRRWGKRHPCLLWSVCVLLSNHPHSTDVLNASEIFGTSTQESVTLNTICSTSAIACLKEQCAAKRARME